MSGFTKPVWLEQGPGPLAQPLGTYSLSAGAVQAIAVDPTNSERVFVASVGGGIWMSDNAGSSSTPQWTPQSDHAPSLTMSTIVLDPLDPTNNTLYAGCGRTTHGLPIVGPRGGPLFGILRTMDGGATWSEISRVEFEGRFVSRILPLAMQTNAGQRILVGTLEQGLHITVDGGNTWATSANVNAPVTDLAVESTAASTVYVAAAGHIFRSSDGGDTDWHDVTPPAWGGLTAVATIRFAISPGTDSGGKHWLYASAPTGNAATCVMFSTDQGLNWNALGGPPGGSKPLSPMAVSPLRPDTVFLPSDAGSPNNFMAVASPGLATTWVSIEGGGANGTGPHTDARDAALSSDGSMLFQANDGGVYRLDNPHGFANGVLRKWTSIVGNLRVTEFHSIAYDSVNDVLFGAAQDNGIPHQTATNGQNWSINENGLRDGFQVGVDNTTLPGAAVHYSSQQSLFLFQRQIYSGATSLTSSIGIDPTVAGTGGVHLNVLEGALTPDNDNDLGTIRWNQSWVVNGSDPTRLLLGTNFLYESFDRGDNLTSLGGLAKNTKGEWIPDKAIGAVTAYAYGHPTNVDLIYVGTAGGLLLRTTAGGLPQPVPTYPGSTPVGIAVDTQNWKRAYILDSTARVFKTSDAGTTQSNWIEITGNLAQFTGDVRSIVALPRIYNGYNYLDAVLVAGYGGVFVTENPGNGRYSVWRKHGANFPNAVVTQLGYSHDRDLLYAGTFGRAAWTLPQASATLLGEPTVSITSSQRNLCIVGWVESTTVTFTALLKGSALLAPPLEWKWTVVGGTPVGSLTNQKVVVTMPTAGTEVVVIITVTDATGYQVSAGVDGMSVTEQTAVLRERLCELLARIRHELIWNPYVNPLGPDGGPDGWRPAALGSGAIAGLPDYRRLEQLMGEANLLLARLQKSDVVKHQQPSLQQLMRPFAQKWATLEAVTGRRSVNLGPSDGAPSRERG